MTHNAKPATPLPWGSEAPMGGFLTTKGHIYHEPGDFKTRLMAEREQLVAALREAADDLSRHGARESAEQARALLRSLGEAQ